MLLAVDTSTRTIGLALYHNTQVISESVWTSRDHHTVELAPSVASMLARAGITPKDVQAVAVATGPGSFTGLRIGLAFAKGIALVRRLPIVGVPSLDILAAAQPVLDMQLAAVLKAGRGRLAVAWYSAVKGAWKPSGPIEVYTPTDLAERINDPTLVCGELEEDERRLLGRRRKLVRLASPAQSLRRPAFLAEIGWKRLQAGQVDDPATLAPYYLHYNDPIPS